MHGHALCVRLLLDAGADKEVRTNVRGLPLAWLRRPFIFIFASSCFILFSFLSVFCLKFQFTPYISSFFLAFCIQSLLLYVSCMRVPFGHGFKIMAYFVFFVTVALSRCHFG